MKKPVRFTALTALGLLSIALGGSQALAAQGQALAAQPTCGATITADTTLRSDLMNCASDGIVIGADNITLDLNGHTIDGDAIPGPDDDNFLSDSIRAYVLRQAVRGTLACSRRERKE